MIRRLADFLEERTGYRGLLRHALDEPIDLVLEIPGTHAGSERVRVPVDVDPPVEHRLAGKAERLDAQQLDHPANRLGIGVGGGIMDREAHQPNRNWRAIAWSSAALSRI